VERFKAYGKPPTNNNRQQAYIPEGAIAIHNPVGTAPCFILEHNSRFIISLPGVPQEMQYILHHEIIPFLKDHYQLKTQIIKATVLHVASMGESMVDEIIADLENYANPTVGLLAHPGQVDIRITAKAGSETQANQMIAPILEDLYLRLGENIYGCDDDTLGRVIAKLLDENNLNLLIVTCGLDESFEKMLQPASANTISIKPQVSQPIDLAILTEAVATQFQNSPEDLVFGMALLENERVTLHLAYHDATGKASQTRHYGGPRAYARLWAGHTSLDYLRRNLIKFIGYSERGTS